MSGATGTGRVVGLYTAAAAATAPEGHDAVDVVPGRGAGFSVEGPTGMRFLIRSRMLTADELVAFGLA